MPRFTHRKVIPIGATARVVAQRAPETLTLVRHRTQSTAETIARLSVTAVFAYLVALPLPLPGAAQPILAPLTALLVVQVSLYQTLRSAVHRVAAVVTGVLLVIALADLAGPPCPAGTVGSPGRGGAPGVSPGRSWQRGQKPGRDEAR